MSASVLGYGRYDDDPSHVVMERLAELEPIVRDLAEFDPAPRSNAFYCSMCGEHTADDISLHAESCAYARAVMWVAVHPAPAEETTSGH